MLLYDLISENGFIQCKVSKARDGDIDQILTNRLQYIFGFFSSENTVIDYSSVPASCISARDSIIVEK